MPKKPEWTPRDACKGFASSVLDGVEDQHDGLDLGALKKTAPARPKKLEIDDYVQGVLAADRMILGRAITLVESNSPVHAQAAQDMLQKLLPFAGKSIRVGITGVPGAGKSTFIEALGTRLCDAGNKVAVLAVDPSSSVTRGSILGDKTRMQKLARHENSFIRPSPSGGILGGVARKSRETMVVCEAAGFDVILVETVGVGQSETTVRSMVDFFLLVLIAGAGDELQGIKRGIMELCDAILVNKADGDNQVRARAARAEFENILHYLNPATPGWITRDLAASSLTGEGIGEVWNAVEEFKKITTGSGFFQKRRKDQSMQWVQSMVLEYLEEKFYQDSRVQQALPKIKDQVAGGNLTPTQAVKTLLSAYESQEED